LRFTTESEGERSSEAAADGVAARSIRPPKHDDRPEGSALLVRQRKKLPNSASVPDSPAMVNK